MALIRNSSPFPVQLVSYQIDKTLFGDQGGLVYPGECRYVNAEHFQWLTCLMTAFTESGNYPKNVEITGSGSVSLEGLEVGVTVQVNHAQSMCDGLIIGKHDFAEFYADGNQPAFRINNGLDKSSCRVNHGW